MNTCQTCKHWEKPERQHEEHGSCQAIPEAGFITPNTEAHVLQGWLMTKPTFGCVLHEPATDES